MIVPVAAFLTAVGFVAWIAGSVLDMPGVATVGAVMIVGVGAMITTGGLEVKTGHEASSDGVSNGTAVEESTNTTVTNETTNSSTTVNYRYEPVETPGTFSVGLLFMLLGGAMTFRSLDRF